MFPLDRHVTQAGFENNRWTSVAGTVDFEPVAADIYQSPSFRRAPSFGARCGELISTARDGQEDDEANENRDDNAQQADHFSTVLSRILAGETRFALKVSSETRSPPPRAGTTFPRPETPPSARSAGSRAASPDASD